MREGEREGKGEETGEWRGGVAMEKGGRLEGAGRAEEMGVLMLLMDTLSVPDGATLEERYEDGMDRVEEETLSAAYASTGMGVLGGVQA